MPQNDWKKMSARKRDALVAEHIMGFQWGDLDNGNEALIPPMMELPWNLTSWHTYDADGYHHGMPYYTTNLSAAWEVVEKMGYFFELQGHPHTGWEATFGSDSASAWSLPEAICLAALCAKGVDV